MASGGDASPAKWKPVVAALTGAAGLALGVWLVWAFLPRDVVLLAGLATAAAGTVLAGLALIHASRLRRSSEKISADIDAVSRRLVRLDADLSELSRRDFPEPRDSFEEVTAEIGLLGGLVRDIAVTMAAHEKDIAGLRSAPPASAAPAPSPALQFDSVPPEPLRQDPPIRFDAPPAPGPKLRPEFREASGLLRAPAPEEAAAPPPEPEPIPLRWAPPIPVRPAPPADPARVAAVLQAFDQARGVELFLQAVVALPQRKLKLYEAQPRLRLSGEDAPAEAATFEPILERHGRLADLDRLVLARSAVITRHLAARGSEALVALSLSPAAVGMPGFLRAVGQFVDAHAELPGRLILGLSQLCWRMLDGERSAALAGMRERGLTFMLDRAGDLHFDAGALAARGVRYVKVSAEALLESDGADIAGADVAAILAREGISLIAEGVEREGEVPDLIELGAALAQGGVFAPPRAVRADALLPPPGMAVETPPVAAEAPVPAGGGTSTGPATPERKPFRAFLRRAG